MKIRSSPLNKRRIPRYLLWLFLICICLYLLFLDRNSFLNVIKQNRELSTLQKKVEYLKTENSRLRSENHRLRTDPLEIERIAREELGLQKPGEKVYRFIPSPEPEKKKSRKDKNDSQP